jgi:phage-related minor tail protein
LFDQSILIFWQEFIIQQESFRVIFMSKVLALIGGLIALTAAILSIFVGIFGFWNITLTVDPIIGNTTTTESWFNAFWGSYNGSNEKMVIYSEQSVEAVSGLLIVLGGVLCLFQKKTATLIGGILILAGLGLWTLNFIDNAKEMVSQLGGSASDLNFSEFFTGQRQWLAGVFTLNWHLGYGYYMALGGAILALVGASSEKK